MKFVVPIYQAIYSVDKQAALLMYGKHKAFYHPIAAAAIEKEIEFNGYSMVSE